MSFDLCPLLVHDEAVMSYTFLARIAVAVPLLLSLPIVLSAQTSAPQQPSPMASPARPNKVFLSGENPVITLRDTPGGSATVTQVSFWRIHWSPVGAGHVCFVTSGAENTPGAIRVAIHDNKALLDYLTNDVLGTFNKAYVDRPFTPIGGGTFASSGDSIKEHREICQAEKYKVELAWRELRQPGLVDILAGSRPTNPFGITYLRILAGSVDVRINGAAAPGVSVPDVSFLAFGETWIK
jgi:hypothetical protein